MKRLINRKCVAMALAILIALSSFSIIGATAVTTNDTTVGASTDVVDSNASIEQQQSNAKATSIGDCLSERAKYNSELEK